MKKTLLAFIAGAAVSALFLTWGGNDSPSGSPDMTDGGRAVDAGANGIATIRAPVRQDTSVRDDADRAPAGSASEATRDVVPPPEDDAAREARLRAELEETRRVLTGISAELEELAMDRELASEPIVSPISLPPEFGWLGDNNYRNLFHERMQRELVDAEWAADAEARLLSFVYDKQEIVQTYGAPTIRCHTTQCEVTFIAADIGGDPSVAARHARSLFDDSFEQLDGMFDCGPGACWADTNVQDGIVTIFWAMTKREQQTQSDAVEVVARN